MAATSTVVAGAAPGADAGFGAADADVPAGAVPAPGAAPAGAVVALAWPKNPSNLMRKEGSQSPNLGGMLPIHFWWAVTGV